MSEGDSDSRYKHCRSLSDEVIVGDNLHEKIGINESNEIADLSL